MGLGLSLRIKPADTLFERAPICWHSGRGTRRLSFFSYFSFTGERGCFFFFFFLLDNSLSEVTRTAEQLYVSFVRLVIGQILVLGGLEKGMWH